MAAAWEQRFARYVAALAALRESTALEVLPDLMPVLPVVDPAAPELRGERGEDLLIRNATAAAVVGQRSLVGVRCLANSNTIIVIERAMFFTGTTAGGVKFTFGAPLGVGTGTPGITRNRRLSRLAGAAALTGVGTGTIFTANIASPGSGYAALWEWGPSTPLGVSQELVGVPVILGPGQDCWLESTVDNQALTASFIWSERVVDGQEQ